MKTANYHVIYEESATGWGAYIPDLPGCVAVAKTRRGVERLIRDAIEFHLEGMAKDGIEPPTPTYGVMAELKSRRQQLGLSQAEIARRLGVNQNYISVIEKGGKSPSVALVAAYAESLGAKLALSG